MIKSQLYLDCDGVLADFDQHFCDKFGMRCHEHEQKYDDKEFWRKIQFDTEGFFENLPLMHGALELFSRVKHLEPIILTGCPKGTWSQPQKISWAKRYFPGTKMITCRSRSKKDYCKPGDILIDDITKYKHLWEEVGGVYIVHKTVDETLKILSEVLGEIL